MANTHGYEIVSELTEDVLKRILLEAWKSASDESEEGVIPEKKEIPAGLPFGPYFLKSGTIQIPKSQLDLKMNTGINGVDIKMGAIVQIQIDNPPIESASFFDLTTDINIATPIRTIDDLNVFAILENLPLGSVQATITSGDPIGPITQKAVEEYVDKRFQDPAFQRILDPIQVPFGPFNMDARVEFFNDHSNPQKEVQVEFPDANHVKVQIPTYLRFYNITGSMFGQSLDTPMGVKGVTEILADYEQHTNSVIAKISLAEVKLTNLQPADDPIEAANYSSNKTKAGIGGFDLDSIIRNAFAIHATNHIRTQLGDIEVFVPTIATIEDFIVQQIRSELNIRKRIFLWKPDPPEGSELSVTDVTIKALPDALAIGLNASPAANAGALTNFIPPDKDFAVALSKEKVLLELEKVKCETYPNLCNGSSQELDEKIEGKTVKLNALNFSLRNGSIHMSGDVTVVDAILGCIDVDASFDADAGMEWIDNADGSQSIRPFLIGEPDTDLPWYAWLLAVLTGLLTFGIVGVIIAVVIVAVVEGVAEKIGARIANDETNDQLKVLSAWPQKLDNIGDITARFNNPIEISPDGILFSGSMIITSTYALTLTDHAYSNGPYNVIGGQVVAFNGGSNKPQTIVHWDFDDGNFDVVRKPLHLYGKSGLYVAKLKVQVTEEGGVTTRHFAPVKIKNVVPIVWLPADFSVKEGEEFSINGHFSDQNWLDKHTATIDFGDNSAPIDLRVTETNQRPQAQGNVSASHRYCDNGKYTITLTVRDDAGGVGTAITHVSVENVPPTVQLPQEINTLVGQPIRLEGTFIDPGWCDTHVGFWDLGDCSTLRSTIIKEKHTSPVGEGKAEIVHIYQKCGKFYSTLTIHDDDNGVGEANLIVNATELKNASFENGFRMYSDLLRKILVIANEWYPYFERLQSNNPNVEDIGSGVDFNADEIICRDGQRAQKITIRGAAKAGIYQRVPVNAGWDYEFNACYHFPHNNSSRNSRACIGIDPFGEENPDASQVVWIEGPTSVNWRNLSVRATANNNYITVFMGVLEWSGGEDTIFWEKASLYQIQPHCTDKLLERTCVDFNNFKPEQLFTKPFHFRELNFTPLGKSLRIRDWGAPSGVMKLGFEHEGIEIRFPIYVDEVIIAVNSYSGRTLLVELLRNDTVLKSVDEIVFNEMKSIKYEESRMNGIRVIGGNNEAAIVRICLLLPTKLQ